MIHLFIDTEFTQLPPHPSRLISIALVSEDGAHRFYAELSDTWDIADCSDFVRSDVLPLLQGGACRLSRQAAAQRLQAWLAAFAAPVTIVADTTYDRAWLDWLLCEIGVPDNVRPGELLFHSASLPVWFQTDAERAAQAWHREHPQHHALYDAEGLRRVWQSAVGDGWRSHQDAG